MFLRTLLGFLASVFTSVAFAASPTVTTDELKAALEKKLSWTIIDVRTPEEFAAGHIPGAVNIPLDTIEKRTNEVPKDKPVVLTCRSGRRSGLAQEILIKAGHQNTRNHLGGFSQWTGPVAK
jgi:phage shock protein E